MQFVEKMNIKLGGSHVKLRKQLRIFETANIPVTLHGSYTLGSKYQMGVMPDTNRSAVGT